MDPIIRNIFDTQGECTSVLKEITRVLLQERSSLIALQMNEIAETTKLKESLNWQLIQKSRLLKNIVEAHFSSLYGLESKLSEEQLQKWKDLREEFWTLHKELKAICEVNQGFLKSSLRNLSSLTDHLRRLFGEQPLYSQKGIKVDRPSQGRVLEASY